MSGALTSTANTEFELDLLVNELCDPDPDGGEGQDYVASQTLYVGSNGAASFDVSFQGSYTPGHFVTATATDQEGNTSQFSNCIPISGNHRVYLPPVVRAPVP